MGEYADYEIGRMIDGWHGGNGRGMFKPRLGRPTCRRCGKVNLRWRQIEGGEWRLYEKSGGVQHDCRAQPSDSSAFEDLT